jgi:hypothetical protein
MLVLLDRDHSKKWWRAAARGAPTSSTRYRRASLIWGSRSAADRIDEVVLIGLGANRVRWLALTDGDYRPTDASRVIDLAADAFAESINWPGDPSP